MPVKPPLPTAHSQTLSRAIPTINTPQPDQAAGNYNTTLSTVFTKAGAITLLYSAERAWMRLTITLETAGPVEVSSVSNFKPFLSGKAQALQTGVPLIYDCAKGSRVWVGAGTVERLKLTVQPLPWLEQITGAAGAIMAALMGRKG